MDYFNYHGDELFAEDLPLSKVAAQFGTPLYVYSKATLKRHIHAFAEALKERDHLICYAVKANGTLAILQLMSSMGAGFDIVSEGELRRVIAAGGDPHLAVYSGVGKSEAEIAFALKQGIRCFNIESLMEIDTISKVAADLNLVAPVSLRVNPDVDAKTMPAISTGLKNNKFGISIDLALEAYKRMELDPHLKVSGIDCHIGSQMTSGAPILAATDRLLNLYAELKTAGIEVDHLDIGGGLGVTYGDETPPSPNEYMSAVLSRIKHTDLAVYIEPGRAMVANAGVLLTQVRYLKQNGDKNFCIVDAGMNDLIRPALYGSWMNIVPVHKSHDSTKVYDVVGPVCESDDFLGKDRRLKVNPNDLLAVRGAGAYGSSMASTYNSRPLCAEVMVDGDQAVLIRKRQSFEQMWENEILPGDQA